MIKIFGHYVSGLFLLLGGLEFALFYASLLAGFSLRFSVYGDLAYAPGDALLLPSALLYASLMSFTMLAMGLYLRGQQGGGPALLVRLGVSFFLASMAMSLVFYMAPEIFLGRGVLSISMLLSLAGVLIIRTLFFYLTDDDSLKHRVLVLGTGENAAKIMKIEGSNEYGFQVVKYISLADEKQSIPEERQVELKGALIDLVRRLDVSELVVAVDDRRKGLPLDDILDCKMSGILVLDLLKFYEKETSTINIDLLQPSYICFSSGFRSTVFSLNIKRVIDFVVSSILLVITSPLFLLVGLASLIESRGKDPVFYSQERVGLNGKLFIIHKFRSMRTDAEADGVARWASENDSRITPLGSFLRKVRLDELPQLLNVLKGDMSLVGPRPERLDFVRELDNELPFYRERHRVRPGVTGWAQLRYQYGASMEDSKEKLQYDLYYVKNTTLFLDLIILLETAEVVIMGKGS